MSIENYDIVNKKRSWREELEKIEASICEGIELDGAFFKGPNLFGRTVLQRRTGNLSYVCGLAISGLRTSALQNRDDFKNSIKQIRVATRQHIPLTVNIDKSGIESSVRELSVPEMLPLPNTIQLIASTAQEAIDFSLIAHRISELALVPVLQQVGAIKNQESNIPTKKQLIQYLGNSDDQVDSPTPSQKMIFGPKRRRIPQWFNYDYPAQLNPRKERNDLTLEKAANQEYFTSHFNQIISNSFDEFETVIGRKHNFLTSYNVEKSQYLIITIGNDPENSRPVIDELLKNRIKVGFLNINVISPFPSSQIEKLVSSKRVITILEPIGSSSSWLADKISRTVANLKSKPLIISGSYSGYLQADDLLSTGTNMASSKPLLSFYCGVEFTRASSAYPKHQVMLQAIDRDYPHLKSLNLSGSTKEQVAFSKSQQKSNISHTIKRHKDLGSPFTQLSRFQDSTSLFYQNSHLDKIVADPFQAVSSMPADSASLNSMIGTRELLPTIDPSKCTACGNCMVQCPNSAMPSLAIGLENLIKSGMEMATAAGVQIIGLLPLVKNLSKSAGKVISDLDEKKYPDSIDQILTPAFEKLIIQANLEGDKLELVKSEFTAVIEALEGFPVNISDIIYHYPDAQLKGSGELFFLAIDPSSCTGCGICAEACEDEAVTMNSESQEILSKAIKEVELWDKLPDTSSDTINRLLFDKDYDSFSALMLSRNFYLGVNGGVIGANNLPTKQIIHLLSAVTESLIQPRYADFIKEIDGLSSNLSENIHTLLSESLPKENFDNIARAISATQQQKVPFNEVLSNISGEDRLKQVDASAIKRKIELLNALKGLRWSLTEGPAGTGRGRMGFSISSRHNFNWADQHPNNPFGSPVVTFNDEFSAELALGIVEGQMRYFLDNLKLIRKAKLEIKNKYAPKEHDKEIASINWEGIDDSEKKLIPPIFLVGEQALMSKNSFESFGRLLTSDYPIKVIILDDLASSPENSDPVTANASQLISTIGFKKAFIYQGSMASPQSMFDGIVEGVHSMTPSLFRIFAPSPANHKTDPEKWWALSDLALNSRSFPNFKFKPDKYSGFLNDCMSVEDNPSPDLDWYSQSIDHMENGEVETLSFDVTWADWALTLKNWESHFSRIEEVDSSLIHISEFIKTDGQNAIPVIYRVVDNKLVCYKVSDAVIEMTRSVKENWDLIRELSGNLVQFPEKLKSKIETELQLKFDADLSKIKTEYDIKLKEQEQLQVEAIRKKLRDKLVLLTNKKK